MTTDNDDDADDPRKPENEEFQKRIENGTITVQEIMFDTIDAHKDKPHSEILPPEITITRMIRALNTRLFYLVIYGRSGPKSDYFKRISDIIKEENFKPNENDPYADADHFVFGPPECVLILMKKSRITREEIIDWRLMEADQDERKRVLEAEEKRKRFETGTIADDVIAWIIGSPEDGLMLRSLGEIFKTFKT
jgi:hypothetical protein